MKWWNKMVFPVRRAWFAVSAARVKSRKNVAGLLKLHDDIQTCGYEDVQIMWEMLRRTESEVVMSKHSNKRKQGSGKILRVPIPTHQQHTSPQIEPSKNHSNNSACGDLYPFR